MKVGDYVQWRDQADYPGLCGIVTQARKDSYEGQFHTHQPREIFVHWTNVPKDCALYIADTGWENEKDLELLSTGETK